LAKRTARAGPDCPVPTTIASNLVAMPRLYAILAGSGRLCHRMRTTDAT
jgi:hypothetical protein